MGSTLATGSIRLALNIGLVRVTLDTGSIRLGLVGPSPRTEEIVKVDYSECL